jgi:hypothetical protein
MKWMRKLFKPLLFVFLLLSAAMVFAQVAAPPAGPSQAVQDYVKNIIDGGIILVVPLLTMFLRQTILPKIPRVIIPFLVYGLTVGLNILSTAVFDIGSWTWLGTLGQAAGSVVIREIINTFNQHKLGS